MKSTLGKGAGRREVLYTLSPAGSRALSAGRKGLVEKTNARFKTVMPVAMRISIGAELDEGLLEMLSSISTIRSRMVSLPAKKRGEALKRIVAGYRKMMRELEGLE